MSVRNVMIAVGVIASLALLLSMIGTIGGMVQPARGFIVMLGSTWALWVSLKTSEAFC